MPPPLDIDDEDVRVLLTAYEAQRQTMQVQLNELVQGVKRINEKIEKLKQSPKGTKPAETVGSVNPQMQLTALSGYNREGTWNDKIKFVIQELRRPLTTSEIVSAIIMHEPERIGERGRVRVSVSATLSVGVSNGIYKRKEKEGEEFAYSVIN